MLAEELKESFGRKQPQICQEQVIDLTMYVWRLLGLYWQPKYVRISV